MTKPQKNKVPKLIFKSEAEIKIFEKQLQERLEHLEMETKLVHETGAWWNQQTDELLRRINELEQSESINQEYIELVNALAAMNSKGEREISCAEKLKDSVDAYFRDKKRFVKAKAQFDKINKKGK